MTGRVAWRQQRGHPGGEFAVAVEQECSAGRYGGPFRHGIERLLCRIELGPLHCDRTRQIVILAAVIEMQVTVGNEADVSLVNSVAVYLIDQLHRLMAIERIDQIVSMADTGVHHNGSLWMMNEKSVHRKWGEGRVLRMGLRYGRHESELHHVNNGQCRKLLQHDSILRDIGIGSKPLPQILT